MRRSIKKAVAFTLAAVTMFANLSIASPVKAAEYDEVKEVLPIKYDDYIEFDDGYIFTDYAEAKNGEDQYLNELVIVGSKGEKTTLNVKGSDNTNKYRYVSPGNGECVYIINDDYTPSIYFADGTWIGNGKVRYDDIYPLEDGNLIVADKNGCHIINKKEEYVKKNVFTNKGHTYMSVDTFGDYLIITEHYYDSEYKSERKILDKNYKEVTGIGHDDCWINTFSDKYFVFTNGKELYFYDSNLKKCIYTFKQNIVTNPSVNAGDGKVLVDYETYYYGAMPAGGGKEYICISIYNIYEDALGNREYDYLSKYLDVETLKEVSEKEFIEETRKPYKVENTEITVDSNGEKMNLYYGDKKIADRDSVFKFASDNIKGSTGAWINTTWGSNGDLYLSIYVYYENKSDNNATLVLEKKSGYSLEKAKFIDKEISDGYTYLGGIIRFVDGTYVLNGKEYDEKTTLSIKYPWYAGSYEEYLATMHYVLETNDGKKVTYTLFDKNHTQVYQSSDMIENMLPKGLILVAKEVEVEGQSYTKRIYGCRYAAKTLVSSQDILDELTQVEEGETVEVEIKKNDPVKAEVFETIKGKDVNVVLNLDNGMSWKINGKNVKGNKLTDINLTVDVVKDVVPVKAIDKVNLKGERIELSLAHTGEFGFSAELTMNVKKENAGKFANRFYYNPETKELEFQEAVKIDANGDATFTYTHASDYVIILSDVSYETMIGKPGDMANIGMLVALLGTAGAAMFVFQKKRDLVK